MRHARRPLGCVLVAVAFAFATAATADEATARENIWMTVGDETLASLRGGFDLGGVMVSFGITRTVAINGMLVATSSFQVPDIGRITPAQAAILEKNIAGAGMVQVGTGNAIASGVLPAAATVIQNTLNGQTIQTRTLIDTTTNGMSLVKSINTGAALHDALRQAVR